MPTKKVYFIDEVKPRAKALRHFKVEAMFIFNV